MEKEVKNEEEKERVLLPKNNSEDSVFYPWEGGGIFLGITSSSSDENAALTK